MKTLPLMLLMIGIFASLNINAQTTQLTKGDYKNRADVAAFIDKMAAKKIYSKAQLIKLFSEVKQQKRLFKKMNNAAERKLAWYQYRKIFMTKKRIQQGIKFFRENKQLLQKISQEYQVPAEIIVAIIGVETYYGRIKGKDPVFDTLVTFAFDFPNRSQFFKSELEHFLALTKEHNVSVTQATGSYAGAMGMPQFISSSFRAYAVDYDNDNTIDLWNNHADILASVANYFKRHGWQPDEAIAAPLSGNLKSVKQFKAQLKPNYRYQDFTNKGLTTHLKNINPNAKVSLIDLQQKKGHDYWAGFYNFYVITRYNHSDMYAMAVYQLSQAIRNGA